MCGMKRGGEVNINSSFCKRSFDRAIKQGTRSRSPFEKEIDVFFFKGLELSETIKSRTILGGKSASQWTSSRGVDYDANLQGETMSGANVVDHMAM